MRLLRNPEWKRFLLLMGAAALAAAAGALWWGIRCALYVLVVCLFFLSAFWILTRKRYARLKELSGQLEDILYGADGMDFLPDTEGELAVLSSRIYKMTVRLREQAGQLREEKTYLKDTLADISHQVKTPLTAARLVLKRLRNPKLTGQERRELLMESERLLSKIERLMDVMLKTARLESGTAVFLEERISVKKVVQAALEPLEILMDLKGMELITDLPESVCFCGDFFWSVEAVGNLLKNCLEHTPDGGKLFVKAEENPIFTRIWIADTGTGFEEEEIPHLFERFFKGKNADSSGSGIGLSLAAMIFRQQNGTIRAGNRTEGGAQFDIRIYKGAV